jgi:hypothetical protein
MKSPPKPFTEARALVARFLAGADRPPARKKA